MSAPRISWKHLGVFLCIYTALGFVAWLIHILSRPSYWCGVIVGAGKAAGVKPLVQDCSPILLALIDKLGSIALVLVGSAAIGILVWVVIALGATLSFKAGGGGVEGDVHGPVPVRVEQPADKPVPVSQETKP